MTSQNVMLLFIGKKLLEIARNFIQKLPFIYIYDDKGRIP